LPAGNNLGSRRARAPGRAGLVLRAAKDHQSALCVRAAEPKGQALCFGPRRHREAARMKTCPECDGDGVIERWRAFLNEVRLLNRVLLASFDEIALEFTARRIQEIF
jgi:hypothetical protein